MGDNILPKIFYFFFKRIPGKYFFYILSFTKMLKKLIKTYYKKQKNLLLIQGQKVFYEETTSEDHAIRINANVNVIIENLGNLAATANM
jgi:hypothetical protein